MVWEGRDAVKTGRVILGATNPLASAPGTIRGDFAIVSRSSYKLCAAQLLSCMETHC
jgi:nucleoside diphosphate kinase